MVGEIALTQSVEQWSSGVDLKSCLITAFPNHRGRILLDHHMRFLFPKPAQAATAPER